MRPERLTFGRMSVVVGFSPRAASSGLQFGAADVESGQMQFLGPARGMDSVEPRAEQQVRPPNSSDLPARSSPVHSAEAGLLLDAHVLDQSQILNGEFSEHGYSIAGSGFCGGRRSYKYLWQRLTGDGPMTILTILVIVR